MTPSEALQQRLTAEANKVEWPVRTISLPATLAAEKSEAPNTATSAFVAGLYPIIVAELGDALERARTSWAQAQRQAATARTTVLADSGEDLVLILIGPPGSKTIPDWIALAMEIERNDLVCRKLVWLPPKRSGDFDAALTDFVRRTFLSKPWLVTAPIAQTNLDALSQKNLMLGRWEEVLDAQPINRADVDYDALVEKLIQTDKP